MDFDIVGFYFPKVFSNSLIIYTGTVSLRQVNAIPLWIHVPLVFALASMTLFTYWKTINLGAGKPTDFPILRINSIDDVMNGVEQPPEIIRNNCISVKRDGSHRFCRECKVWKPDRCHHCSKCNCCYLRMDHHCPWLATCVGFNNQRIFTQFLLYLSLYSLYVFLTTSLQLYWWIGSGTYQTELLNTQLLILWLLGLVASIGNVTFTVCNIWLLVKNETTIERYEWNRIRSDLEIVADSMNCNVDTVDNVYDLGSKSANFNSIMGTTWKEWFLPTSRITDDSSDTYFNKGLYFPIQNRAYSKYRESIDLQQRLLTRLTPKPSMDLMRD